MLEILCGILLLPKDAPSETFSFLCILINSCVVFAYIIKKFEKPYVTIVFFAYLARVLLMCADYYKWFHILHSGADSEGFYASALDIMNSGSFDTFIYTNYSYFNGSIFLLIGPQRLFIQHLNTLLGLGAIYYVYNSFLLLKVDKTTKLLFLSSMCFFPHNIIFSGILLREAWIAFFASISLYCFIRWICTYKFYDFIVSCCWILLAVWMHSGMMGILIIYLLAFSGYKFKEEKIALSFRSIILLTLSALFLSVLISQGIFTEYFNSALEERDASSELIKRANLTSEGGSRYLTWTDVSSPVTAFLCSPLKMVYLLFSPMPFDWRGINDIAAFFISSIFFIYLVYTIFSGLKYINNRQYKIIIKFIIIAVFIFTFLYGYGTSTAGTAMRHRTKIVPFLIVAAAVSYNYKIKNKSYYDRNKNVSNS
jgi:hypothetical protein